MDGPLIYISLGTIFNDQPDFYRVCFETFGNGSHQTVIVLPSQTDISQIGPIPENFIVAPYCRSFSSSHALGAFVIRRGMSSLQEALSFGVPMVVFPQMFEQIISAQQI